MLDLAGDRPGATRDAIAFLTERVAVEDITITEAPLEEVIRVIYGDSKRLVTPGEKGWQSTTGSAIP